MQNNHFNHQMNHYPHHQTSQFPTQFTHHTPPPIPQYDYENDGPHHPQQEQQYTEYEKRLIDEVNYLHSLWRRGPPRQHSQNPHLKPSHTTHFKKTKKPEKEWPVEPKPTSNGPGWAPFPAHKKPISRPASDEERARVLGVKVQLKGVKSCSLFIRSRNAGENDSEDDDEEEEEDGDDEEEVGFFVKVFEEDKELKGYYEKNSENGEFYCLVCGAIGDKVGRKYKNCVALVQHSVSISKTKKKKAHRAYAKAVCKVLGWDIDDLSSLQSSITDVKDSGQTLEKSSQVEGEVKNPADVESRPVAESEGNAETSSQCQAEQKDTSANEILSSQSSVADVNAIGQPLEKSCEVQGEVNKNTGAENASIVEMEQNASSKGLVLQKDIPDAVEKDSGTSTDARCVSSGLADIEREGKGSADSSDVNDHDNKKDVTHGASGNAPSQQDDTSAQKEVVHKTGEGCSVLGTGSTECRSPLTRDAVYEHLPSLSGEFQIPE